MVVCKFFLQGTCKFGDFCKFEHQINDNYNNYQGTTSILRQSHFGNAQQQPKPATNPSNVDTNTLVKSVVNDMTVAEKGGQWLLSCYAPFKEKPAFPGFEDQSFEEIRYGYYEAVKNGTVEQYKQQVQMMLQQAVMRLKSLQSPSPDIVNLLKCIYDTPASSHCGVYGSNTATTTTAFTPQQPSVFGQQAVFAQPNQSIFGNALQSQNQFGNGTSNSIFGSTQNQVFGGQAPNSVFGSAPNSGANIFQQGNANSFSSQSSGSIFGGQVMTPQANTGSIFSGAGGGSIFGGQQTSPGGFGAQQTSTLGMQMQQNAGNVFGNNNFAGGFGQSPQSIFQSSAAGSLPQQQSPPGNVFQRPQGEGIQNSLFSQQQQAQAIFTPQNVGGAFNQQSFGQQSVVDAKSHSNSIFGSNAVSNPAFGQTQPVDESVYSKLEELTEEEIKWFESDDLDVLKIPEKPPTYQMCFKT
ncbi:hypothetical protein NQ315_009805 [Exocentrus adspersus]|uniref:Nucleoporin NUP42 n=1 Tax=Exocentrus adspersus TaxID=1586481 RepID=A0AAV8WHB1_9CUCU|nr:hypothetical protein NQ315_009805 [Exocentrus adspersus]